MVHLEIKVGFSFNGSWVLTSNRQYKGLAKDPVTKIITIEINEKKLSRDILVSLCCCTYRALCGTEPAAHK